MVELVIKIDEDTWKRICNSQRVFDISGIDIFSGLNTIKNGIPLPKKHGDLIDRTQLLKQPMDLANCPSNYVQIAPTIIEADKLESEK